MGVLRFILPINVTKTFQLRIIIAVFRFQIFIFLPLARMLNRQVYSAVCHILVWHNGLPLGSIEPRFYRLHLALLNDLAH